MKKILLMLGVLALLVFGVEEGKLGYTPLQTNSLADINNNKVGNGDTLKTDIYEIWSVKGMSHNTSLWMQVDSTKDSTWFVTKLQESWDGGTTWELTTTVCSVATVAASIDTAVDVDLFPAPWFRFIWIELGANADTFELEDAGFYNQPGDTQ